MYYPRNPSPPISLFKIGNECLRFPIPYRHINLLFAFQNLIGYENCLIPNQWFPNPHSDFLLEMSFYLTLIESSYSFLLFSLCQEIDEFWCLIFTSFCSLSLCETSLARRLGKLCSQFHNLRCSLFCVISETKMILLSLIRIKWFVILNWCYISFDIVSTIW